jgi:3-oxoacyl-[acyl-carrier protein] reductase
MQKTVLITGGGRGIGAEISKIFAQNKYDLIITCRGNLHKANSVAQECKQLGAGRVDVVRLDLTDLGSICRAANNIGKLLRGRQFSAFISNAGILKTGPIDDMLDSEVQKIYAANIIGPTLLTDRLFRWKPKVMVFIGSDLAKVPKKLCAHYASSKAALRMYVQSLAVERYRAFCVNPDTTATEMTNYQGRDPKQVAAAVYQTVLNGYGKPPGSDIDVWEVIKKA